MGVVRLGVANEKSAGLLANPLNEPRILRAPVEGRDSVERVCHAAAGPARAGFRRLSPFVNHRKRQPKLAGNLLGSNGLENFAKKLVRLHGSTMRELKSGCKPTLRPALS